MIRSILGIVVITLLIASIFLTGCTGSGMSEKSISTASPQERTNTSSDTGMVKTISQNSTEKKASGSDDDRYYYNIRIVEPSDLESMQKELETDESLVHDEKGTLIGIVSPRKLYLRGDLAQIEKNAGRSGKTYDKEDIANHLLDIAFGMDNSKLTLLKSDKEYEFWFDAYYAQSDVDFVKSFAKTFNTWSQTTRFNKDNDVALGFLQTNYATIPYNYYNIKIITEKMLDDYKDDRVATDYLVKDKEGTLVAIFSPDHLYMLDTLNDKERQEYMLKGILYSMGLHGVAYNSKDSFFSRDAANKNLSDLDIEAIKLLYGGRLKNGMTLEESKKTLGLQT